MNEKPLPSSSSRVLDARDQAALYVTLARSLPQR